MFPILLTGAGPLGLWGTQRKTVKLFLLVGLTCHPSQLINCFILLDLLLNSHITMFVSNVSHHLQLALISCPVLAGDDPASIIHAFNISWLEYSCVINLGMTPTALRKLQLIEKAGTHLHRHTGYHGSTMPPYRDFPWNFSSGLNYFSTIKKKKKKIVIL